MSQKSMRWLPVLSFATERGSIAMERNAPNSDCFRVVTTEVLESNCGPEPAAAPLAAAWDALDRYPWPAFSPQFVAVDFLDMALSRRQEHPTPIKPFWEAWKRAVDRADEVRRIQAHWHTLIRQRALEFGAVVHLPSLGVPLSAGEYRQPWWPLDGMYGGFDAAWMDTADEFGSPLILEVASWSRIADGSGQRHRITENGVELIEEGFV